MKKSSIRNAGASKTADPIEEPFQKRLEYEDGSFVDGGNGSMPKKDKTTEPEASEESPRTIEYLGIKFVDKGNVSTSKRDKADAPQTLELESIDTKDYGWNFASSDAEIFKIPKEFDTSAELIDMPKHVPTIFISNKALFKILHMVSAIELEVGWLGVARRTSKNNFVIDKIFLVNQEVGFGHSILSTDGMSDLTMRLLKKSDGEDILNNIRFWGHSHGNGGVEPSGQDDQQMQDFRNLGADFYIRGIFNRKGDVGFSIFDWENNVMYHDVPWALRGSLLETEDVDKMRKKTRGEMRAKVYTRVVPKTAPATPYRPVHQTYRQAPPAGSFYWWRKFMR